MANPFCVHNLHVKTALIDGGVCACWCGTTTVCVCKVHKMRIRKVYAGNDKPERFDLPHLR